MNPKVANIIIKCVVDIAVKVITDWLTGKK